MKIIQEKINQSIEILNELGIDMWLTFVRESDSTPDPVSNLIVGSGACGSSQALSKQLHWSLYHHSELL